MEFKVIITGATGLVGEGVLLECLQNPAISQVLMINRKSYELTHAKLTELIVPDFLDLGNYTRELTGYDACFYCAGISSRGMSEPKYKRITHDITLYVAHKLIFLNPEMVFCFISGSHTDSTEKGKIMWARIKGKTENALMRLPFRQVYAFRPGLMKPSKGQKNVAGYYKAISFFYPVIKLIFPSRVCTLREVGRAMINSKLSGHQKKILEIEDIKLLAAD